MIIGGMYSLLVNGGRGGLNNPNTVYGIDLIGSGFILLQIGRFGAWWSKN